MGVGVGIGALVAAKILANCWMASMVWVPKPVKGAAGVGLERESARHLAASVVAYTEYIVVMAPLWGKMYCFCCEFYPCLHNVNVVTLVVDCDVPMYHPYFSWKSHLRPCCGVSWMRTFFPGGDMGVWL